MAGSVYLSCEGWLWALQGLSPPLLYGERSAREEEVQGVFLGTQRGTRGPSEPGPGVSPAVNLHDMSVEEHTPALNHLLTTVLLLLQGFTGKGNIRVQGSVRPWPFVFVQRHQLSQLLKCMLFWPEGERSLLLCVNLSNRSELSHQPAIGDRWERGGQGGSWSRNGVCCLHGALWGILLSSPCRRGESVFSVYRKCGNSQTRTLSCGARV